MYGIYARLSRDPTGQETSTGRQVQDCKALAQAKGLEVGEVYRDTDLSGFDRAVVRPDYERMLADLEAGTIKGIIVWKLDRLSRQPGQFEKVLETLQRTGASLYSVNDPADITSPSGLAMLRIGMTFAALESETISLRVRAAKLQEAKEGKWHGGSRPYGYESDGLTLIPHEAQVIVECVQRVLRGDSLALITRDLESNGVTTTTGLGYWQPTNLKKVLTSWRIAGFREHHGERYPAQWPAIVDEETLLRVRSLLMGKRRKTYGPHKYLLNGLAYCSKCGNKLYPHYKDKGQKRRYACQRKPGGTNCGGLSCLADPLEETIWEILVRALEAGDLGARLAELQSGHESTELQELVSALHTEQAKLEQLSHDHYVEGTIARPLFLDLQKSLSEHIGALQSQIQGLGRQEALEGLEPGESLRDAFTSRPFLWKRALVEGAISKVILKPSTRGKFRPERIEIEWRV